ncbi:RING-type E3 ubiquitin-protein ligase PPIL2 [Sarcophilus harrisii]|uniref:RING-type E3 ubiquitin-protein ligase PPIL2 n=1 Tax=Sarcophilus harrisii TaxID=9305 RepID=UPI001301C01A|nr:RING-type E3 ubiquitin-protein ligase PPIL2 [Sarcophilus harrisii]
MGGGPGAEGWEPVAAALRVPGLHPAGRLLECLPGSRRGFLGLALGVGPGGSHKSRGFEHKPPFQLNHKTRGLLDRRAATLRGSPFSSLSFRNIVPWIKKYGTNPSSGEKLDAKSLIKLNFTKNSEGKYHCPVLFTVFTNNSHIVAIKSTGNVYAYEAVEQLNIKTKNFKDLLTDEPFSRQDILTLQDPTNLDKFNVANFYHVKNNLRVLDPGRREPPPWPGSGPFLCGKGAHGPPGRLPLLLRLRQLRPRCLPSDLTALWGGPRVWGVSARAQSVMFMPSTRHGTWGLLRGGRSRGLSLRASCVFRGRRPGTPACLCSSFHQAHYSTGMVSASFTSTAMVPETTHEAAAIDDDVVRYRFVKKKGYVRLHTNKGDLNLELHCDLTPKTCENFIKLCKKNYYDGTIFHRSIRNFVIQGGDPTGTGTGGQSCWGKPFKDEFRPNLSHTGRGILSMANSGPNCNMSQFFITFRSCAYLDKKHTVFGRVVGGFDTLTALENVESDPKTDRPKEEIRIESATVFVDPYEEADAQVAKEREKTRLEEEAPKVKAKVAASKPESSGPRAYHQGVGKYISPEATKRAAEDQPSTSASVAVKKKPGRGFGDFSSW